MPEIFSDKRPDIDNLAKSVIDGLNSVAFNDDAQIADLHITKKYHAGNANSKTIVIIEKIKESNSQKLLPEG
jgi:Holliday junction resolvase RusA-like endonuclease